MEYYLLPAFLVLNGEFNNNIGTPLEVFNIILVVTAGWIHKFSSK